MSISRLPLLERLRLALLLALGIDSPSVSLERGFRVAAELATTELGRAHERLSDEHESLRRRHRAMHRRAQRAEGFAALFARGLSGRGLPRQKRSVGCLSWRGVGALADTWTKAPRGDAP